MAVKFPIFMDAQSTTPVDPRVLAAMLPYFTERFGHPASRTHPYGWDAERAVERAREQIARLIGARDPREIVFTSGGTESINLALKGVADAYRDRGDHIVTTVIEQRAGLDVARRLERQGLRVTYVPVGPTAWSTRPRSARRSRTGRSCSRSCSPTTRSGRSRRSPPSVASRRTGGSCFIRTPPRRSARSRST